MTARATDPDDPIDAPFLDEAERAEVAWLQSRDTDPAAPAPSPAIADAYAQLEASLAAVGARDGAADDGDGWQDAVIASARAAAATSPAATAASPAATATTDVPIAPIGKPAPAAPSRTPTWRRWAISGGALAAAAIALFLVTRRPTAAAELEVATRRGDTVRGGSQAVAVGDRLVVVARPRGATELRVYRAPRAVLARCPGAAGCAAADPTWRLEIPLTTPGPHQVVLVFGETHAPAEATLDDYLAAARAAGARYVLHPAIDVN